MTGTQKGEGGPAHATVGDWSGRLPDDKLAATARHRRQQGIWRSTVARWPAGQPQNDARVRARYPTLPNWLAHTYAGQDVVETGINLMSQEARDYTKDRLQVLEAIDGKAEPDRLWRNLLSSQPMAFSIAGHLHAHPAEAVELLSELTGLNVASQAQLNPGPDEWSHHRLDGIDAEWFPPREEHTRDMSGADIAACLELADGRRVLLTVEVKYTDSFSHKPVSWARYKKHLTALGLDETATAALAKAGCSQVLRQVMMTDSVRRRGLTAGAGPEGRVDDGMAVVFGREDDRTAQRVVSLLDRAVGTTIPVRFWSHRDLFDQARKINVLRDWAEKMAVRYLPDDRTS